MGAYHGEAGFRAFSHMKPVFYQARVNGSALFDPPSTPLKAFMRRMLRRIV